MAGHTRESPSLPLWPLPLCAALLPLFVTHLAWWLSARAGRIPICNAYLDGCLSISRAARHGLGNDLFRLLMLPAATLQALCWIVAAVWLRRETQRRVATLPWLGVISGAAMVAYATFLGSEGAIYRLLRHYGTIAYFGGSGLALLVALRALWHKGGRQKNALLVLALGMLAIGLTSVGVTIAFDEPLRDRARNILEWHLGLWLTAVYLVLAWLWRNERWRLTPY